MFGNTQKEKNHQKEGKKMNNGNYSFGKFIKNCSPSMAACLVDPALLHCDHLINKDLQPWN